jgi:pyruvate-ferredoxin/flavodoxin oxidoreductase
VANVAFGARDAQTVKAFLEAEAYPGPSMIIAYSHCIAHGYDMAYGLDQQKLAVETGYWPLYRYDPRAAEGGESPLKLESAAPKLDLGKFMRNETRFRVVEQQNPDRYRKLLAMAQHNVGKRRALYEELARGATPTAKPAVPGQPPTDDSVPRS